MGEGFNFWSVVGLSGKPPGVYIQPTDSREWIGPFNSEPEG
jgi:hypothetical protein